MDSFREEYHTKFGREPYVNPVTRFRWFVEIRDLHLDRGVR